MTKRISWVVRVYCVYADSRTTKLGTEALAGIGWFILPDGRGMFYEHEENCRKAVECNLHENLLGFIEIRDTEPDESLFHMKAAGITCESHSVCAMVMAVFQAKGWDV